MSTSETGGRIDSLDGLRAIAVTLVVLFHLGLSAFASGFVGVDMFFVLSGFLITTLLLAEHRRDGTISLSGFWARRARRLLPAVGLLLLVIAIVGPRLYTYSQVTTLRSDLWWSTAYLANWRFIGTSSYFAFTGFVSPLQHLWSLGIEEQFYLGWPLLVAAALRLSRRTTWPVVALITVLAGISVALLAILYDPLAVERAYMGTDARIFQPLVGALGAVFVARGGASVRLARLGMPMVLGGAALLGLSLVLIEPGGAFYFRGGGALVALATLLMVVPLWQGRSGPVGRVLSWRPLVALGVISYGVYLWHWPITLWLHANDPGASQLVVRRIAAAALTVASAALSYRLVERPIRTAAAGRHREGLPARRLARRTIAIALGSLVLIACVSTVTTRVPAPSPAQPVVLLAGDSVPERLAAAFDDAAAERGWRVFDAAVGGCPVSGDLLVPEFRHHPNDPDYCAREAIGAQDRVIAQYDPDVVVWWDRYSLGSVVTPQGEVVQSGTNKFWELKGAVVDAAVDRLTRRGATVLFVATEPYGIASRDFSQCTDPTCGTDWGRFVSTHYDDITRAWNALLADYAASHPDVATFVSITDLVCRTDVTRCDDRIDGQTARPDGIHYIGEGAHVVTEAVLRAVTPLLPSVT